MQYAALHPESRALLGSWEALNGPGDDRALARTQTGTDGPALLDRLFLMQRLGEGVFMVRTAGSELKAWTGRDLRDCEVATLFQGADRGLIRALLEAAVAAPGPAVARAAAFGAGPGQRQEVELVFLPLIERGAACRVLGLFQPLSARPKVSRPVLRLSLTALLPPDPPLPEPVRLRLVSTAD